MNNPLHLRSRFRLLLPKAKGRLERKTAMLAHENLPLQLVGKIFLLAQDQFLAHAAQGLNSVLSAMATGLASRQAMMPTAALACCMAGLAVETMGNTPISATALRNSLEEVLPA